MEIDSSELKPGESSLNVLYCTFLLCRFPFVSVSIGFTVKKEVGFIVCESHIL